MAKPKFLCGNKAQSLKEHLIKEVEAEKIASLKEALKGVELGYESDINTIPIVKINVQDLVGVTEYPWNGFWEYEEKINLETPVVLGREKNVIAGNYQYHNAIEKGLPQINAVYLDSLYGKSLTVDNLRMQFVDESICTSFAYILYALIFGREQKISYSEFCKKIEVLFVEDEIWYQLHQYINEHLIS